MSTLAEALATTDPRSALRAAPRRETTVRCQDGKDRSLGSIALNVHHKEAIEMARTHLGETFHLLILGLIGDNGITSYEISRADSGISLMPLIKALRIAEAKARNIKLSGETVRGHELKQPKHKTEGLREWTWNVDANQICTRGSVDHHTVLNVDQIFEVAVDCASSREGVTMPNERFHPTTPASTQTGSQDHKLAAIRAAASAPIQS